MLFTENFLAVSRIAESIFEGLPSDEAPAFFTAFSDAVERNGKDLSRVVWQFLAAELRSLPPVTPEVQAVIDPVIDGMDLLSEGEEWPEEDASAAARAANAADSPVAWAAASAAYCAVIAVDRAASAAVDTADAASAAARVATRCRQRDLLLTLIKEAPVTTTQENN